MGFNIGILEETNIQFITPIEKQLLACGQILIETTFMTEEYKIILKPEIPMMFWVMLKEHSDRGMVPREFHTKMEMVYTRSYYQRDVKRRYS